MARVSVGGRTYQESVALDAGLFGRVDAGPVRLRRNGRQPKAVGLYFSIKAGRHLPYESKLELHDLWRAEVDSRVTCSFPQPFTLQVLMDGKLTRYTPDRLDVLEDGSCRVIEVKDELSAAEVSSRYGPIAELLTRRGLSFEVRQRAEIELEPSFSGVEAVQRHRRTRLAEADVARLRRALQHGAMPLRTLAARLIDGPAALSMVCAAAVRRVVRIDLSAGLRAAAAVELVA